VFLFISNAGEHVMAEAGTVIDFMDEYGQRVEFVEAPQGNARETDRLKVILWVQPGAYRSGPHIHPQQTEIINTLEGTVIMKIDGVEHTLTADSNPGIAEGGVPHDFWITEGNPAKFELILDPALNFGDFLETMIARAHGYPHILQLSVMMAAYRRENQFPPTLAARAANLVLIMLSPLGYALGYRP
jgi:quercetin dioxygenase-like cupin family protein